MLFTRKFVSLQLIFYNKKTLNYESESKNRCNLFLTITDYLAYKALVKLSLIHICYLITHKDSKIVKDIFAGLRPAIIGLIAAAAVLLMNKEDVYKRQHYG